MDLLDIADTLTTRLRRLRFGPPVTHVYNPHQYARAMYARYLERFGCGQRRVLLLGMNPGPWGMAQTGIPFGEVESVRDWMKLEAPIAGPRREHPRRPVLGLACRRREVSGARLWGWAGEHFGTPKRFFARFFATNYCPLLFLRDSGANLTPDKLSAPQRQRLFRACDRALRDTVTILRPTHVVGIGRFAEARARLALDGEQVRIGHIPHPSPASPMANRGWAGQATAALEGQGIRIPASRGADVVGRARP